MKRLTRHIYVGSEKDSRTPEEFDVVVNCSPNLPFFTTENQISVRIPFEDGGFEEDNAVLRERIPAFVERMDAWVREDKRVLVHCRMGFQRSCTVIAAYLIWRHAISARTAVSVMQHAYRYAFFGGPNFEAFLEGWAAMCGSRTPTHDPTNATVI